MEKPRDPMNQSSRCNKQEGLFSVAQTGQVTLISWEAEHTEQQFEQAFIGKNHIVSTLHTGYKAIGYNIIYTI